MEKIING